MNTQPGFSVAAFVIDGHLEGTDFWSLERLSPKWLGVCSEVLESHGEAFVYTWPDTLSHIALRWTSVPGAALATFTVRGHPFLLAALAKDRSQASAELLEMFVDSLARSFARFGPESASQFAQMLAIQERPVLIVVPVPHAEVTAQDQDLVRELSIHLAGAYLCAATP